MKTRRMVQRHLWLLGDIPAGEDRPTSRRHRRAFARMEQRQKGTGDARPTE